MSGNVSSYFMIVTARVMIQYRHFSLIGQAISIVGLYKGLYIYTISINYSVLHFVCWIINGTELLVG